MTDVNTRWKIAHQLDRLRSTCWCSLVDYVLSHRVEMDREERQFLFRRTRDDGGEVTMHSMLRRLIFGDRESRHCVADAQKGGSCYCGKFATKEVRDKTSLRPKFIVLGLTNAARMEKDESFVNRTDGFLGA